ncbi:MAG: hypothetical protein Q8M88_02200 [Phenylobacterium sp.]|nr:hypothetical protein [Phenylobacterium sp.]MDP3173230.1 hypothetical protein [Phenylobacterium sp.]
MLSTLVVAELALVYFLGALTGRPLWRIARRVWRRLRGGRRGDWDGYFKN